MKANSVNAISTAHRRITRSGSAATSENAPEAFIGMEGRNFGKLIVRVDS